jgi:phosphoglycolate phosphatase
MMERIRGIVFDLDGTLADTFGDITCSVNHVRCFLGLAPLSLPEVKQHVGKGVKNLIEKTTGMTDANRLEELVSVFRRFYLEHLLDTTRLCDGVAQGIEALSSRGSLMAILSNKPEDATRKIAEGLGIARFFKAIFGGDSFEKQKPAKEALLRTLDVLGIRVSQALMVGDSIVDIETAKNAGTRCAVVTTGLLDDVDLVKGRVFLVAEDIARLVFKLEGLGLL